MHDTAPSNTDRVPDARGDHGMATVSQTLNTCRIPDAREDHGLANDMTCTRQHHPTQAVYRMPARITEWPLSGHYRHLHNNAPHTFTHDTCRVPDARGDHGMASLRTLQTLTLPYDISHLMGSHTVTHVTDTSPCTGCSRGSRSGQSHRQSHNTPHTFTHGHVGSRKQRSPSYTHHTSSSHHTSSASHTAPAHQAASARRRLAHTRDSKAAVSSCM